MINITRRYKVINIFIRLLSNIR